MIPAPRAMLLIAAEGNIDATVNRTALGTPQSNVPPNMFLEPPVDEGMLVAEPTREECRSFYVPGQLLRAGDNDIVIANREHRETTIERADLGLWH